MSALCAAGYNDPGIIVVAFATFAEADKWAKEIGATLRKRPLSRRSQKVLYHLLQAIDVDRRDALLARDPDGAVAQTLAKAELLARK